MKLNMGCGKDIRKGFINLDIQKGLGINVIHDLEKLPYPFKTNTFKYVFADNVLEHLSDVTSVLDELYRICKKGAVIEIIVPWYNSKGMFNDVTHKTFFNQKTFYNLTETEKHKYKIHSKRKFEIISQKFIPQPFGWWTMIFPTVVRTYIANILGNMIKVIHIKLKVIK